MTSAPHPAPWWNALGAPLTRTLSRGVGALAEVRAPWAVRAYARWLRVDLSEVKGDLASFETLQSFFVRELEAGSRPLDPDPRTLACPADGRIVSLGTIAPDLTIRVKGRPMSLSEMLDGLERPETFSEGSYLSVYLSPVDYHRVHAPADGRIVAIRDVPGALYPVGSLAHRWIPGLYVRNQRKVFEMATPGFGRTVLVMVGATNVGSIQAAVKDGATVLRGQEIGRFELGSSVVVLTERPVRSDVLVGDRVRCRQGLGAAPRA